MRWPKFLKRNGTIGVVAPSDGFKDAKYIEACIKSEKKLKELGYTIKYSNNCFNSKNGRSSDGETRAKEFMKMYLDPNVDIIISISGGEYEMEILKYLPLRKIKNKPKLFCGYSDNTVLSYVFLTNLEMINIYGHNFYELFKEHEVIENYIKTLTGDLTELKELKEVSSKDFDYESKELNKKYKIDSHKDWKLMNCEKTDVTGIMIGGLIENLISICGTKYDKTKSFIKKYKDEGYIWYIDICLMSPEFLKRSLFQLKNASWFKYAKAILVGRPIITETDDGVDYHDVIYDELKDLNIPLILDFDISHIPPSSHVVNGAKARLTYKNNEGKIKFYKGEK